MALSLSKGGRISLNKEAGAAGLTSVTVGLGWEERATDGTDFDLDAIAFVCGSNGKVRGDGDFIFYNQLTLADGTVEHMGDNLVGGTGGDDEQLKLNLATMAPDISSIVVCVTIHEAEARNQTFGMVNNAFVRVVNDINGQELTRYDLSEDMSIETAMIFCEIYRYNTEWKFKAVGQGFAGGLGPLARNYNVNV